MLTVLLSSLQNKPLSTVTPSGGNEFKKIFMDDFQMSSLCYLYSLNFLERVQHAETHAQRQAMHLRHSDISHNV